MTPEEKDLLVTTAKKLDEFLDIYYRNNFLDKEIMSKQLELRNKLSLSDGTNIEIGGTNGSKIGGSSSKIGFFGSNPTSKQSSIASPSGGTTVDSQARTAINTIITVLQNLGLTS